jgi:glycosyltransferase involved in cell wall biosynthesis
MTRPNDEGYKARPLVVILQHRLLHYRVDFFERLRGCLNEQGIDFRLVHGQAAPAERGRQDEGNLPWADRVNNTYFSIGNTHLCWQPRPASLREADLVVMIQENRVLSNLPIMLNGRMNRRQRIAFWGHGINYQSERPNGWSESFKRRVLGYVDWWFAYTDATVNALHESGYPPSRITCLNNAIDTDGFTRELKEVSEESLDSIRKQLGMERGVKTGLFCGSLYAAKRLDLLIAAADIIHTQVPGFRLIVVGDGPESGIIKQALDSRPWIHWVGVQKGMAKAAYYRLADVILNPGAVGLHVLDAFSAGLPMITTKTAKHGPEVVYLTHGVNGFLTHDSPHEYANAVIDILQDSQLYNLICSAASKASEAYTLPNMVNNFADGVMACLQNPKKL